MRSPWATAVNFRRGWLGQLGALTALLGFLFTATTPGLALVNTAGKAVAVTGVLGVYVCHAQGAPRADLPGTVSSTGEECCLVCQTAQLANGAVPPQHFTLPTESAVVARQPACAHFLRDGEARCHAQARAPPTA